ncbi:sugar ABC transporter substrate-binding protein [Phytoactinopolyspora endophytica]|uniref:sugar ABC transporter substrate-binding protein n=1 Tax=Phytoactinopolyspora endophytica TaxID=1642495 RepID=UPI00101C480F|nr:sugar ABC transporter substrate-binding protein [Phytoactinopolyspora endophytica]
MSGSARTFAIVCALPALALVLTACGSDSSDEVAADDEQTLTVWAMGEEGQRLQEVADEFNEEFPNVTIDVTPVGWDQAHQKLVAAAAGGELPDVAQMGSTMMGEFIELDVLEPIDTSTFSQDDFFPAAWENNVVDDEVYAVPWYVDTRVLYYRTDLADEAGATHPPATWDELKELAVAYQEQAGTQYGISLPAGGEGAWQSLLPFLYSAGGSLVDDDGNATLDTPEATKALEEYASYFDEGLSNTSVQPGQTVEQDFGSGDAPMFISGPWMVNNISEALPELDGKWAAVPLPADEASVSWVGGASLVTFTDSQHKAAAQEFISFLTSPEKQADWYEVSRSLPANMAAWDDPRLAEDPQLNAFEEQLSTAGDVPAMSQWNEFAHELDVAIEQMANGGADPTTTASELQAAAEPLTE